MKDDAWNSNLAAEGVSGPGFLSWEKTEVCSRTGLKGITTSSIHRLHMRGPRPEDSLLQTWRHRGTIYFKKKRKLYRKTLLKVRSAFFSFLFIIQFTFNFTFRIFIPGAYSLPMFWEWGPKHNQAVSGKNAIWFCLFNFLLLIWCRSLQIEFSVAHGSSH